MATQGEGGEASGERSEEGMTNEDYHSTGYQNKRR